MKEDPEVNFLRESNAIEQEYSAEALEDAQEAWELAKKIDALDRASICGLHEVLMKRLNPGIAGKIRKVNVRVGLRICPNPGALNRMLYMWIETHGKAKTEDDIKLAHVSFEDIHPFEDGNGRVGRIVMNWQRLKAGLPMLVILEKEKHAYYDWFIEN